jgi:hypothetical protein
MGRHDPRTIKCKCGTEFVTRSGAKTRCDKCQAQYNKENTIQYRIDPIFKSYLPKKYELLDEYSQNDYLCTLQEAAIAISIDCELYERPCLFLRCKYHKIHQIPGVWGMPDDKILDILGTITEPCGKLDGVTPLSRERARQIEYYGLKKFKLEWIKLKRKDPRNE